MPCLLQMPLRRRTGKRYSGEKMTFMRTIYNREELNMALKNKEEVLAEGRFASELLEKRHRRRIQGRCAGFAAAFLLATGYLLGANSGITEWMGSWWGMDLQQIPYGKMFLISYFISLVGAVLLLYAMSLLNYRRYNIKVLSDGYIRILPNKEE